MRILYVAMKYDYGKVEQGYSFEHYNFYHSLFHMGHDIIYFDFLTLLERHGRKEMNRKLLEVAKAQEPDLMFTVLFKDELDRAALREIKERTDTVTLNWFCDDHWRFENFSRFWAPSFDWIVTTAKSALPKYKKMGYRNVIKSQWACNHFLYKKLNLPLKYDITFIGQPHGDRRETVQSIREAGFDIRTWGSGWYAGRLSQSEMIRIFNQSRINLNLSNASACFQSVPLIDPICRLIGPPLELVPFGSKIKHLGKCSLSAIHSNNFKTLQKYKYKNNIDQIKGRNFEIPGCGGFVLTGYADNLEEYYEMGKEVVFFEDGRDLIEKVRYYLNNEEERATIAQAGYERTLHEHTYVHRFEEIFRRLGLPHESAELGLKGYGKIGKTLEVQ